MTKLTKKQKLIQEKIDKTKLYPLTDAIKLLQSLPKAQFNESVDLSINLGIDPKKSDQNVRAATTLPHGTGKTVKVAVFAQGENATKAKEAGADLVGLEDLAADIKKGEINFDVVIASPDTMRVVGQLGQILGPRGLMPNPKVGTVTQDVVKAIKDVKAGQATYRNDKAGVIHTSFGKIDFPAKHLEENLHAVVQQIKKIKPSSTKGQYIKKMTLSTTMGAGVTIDIATLAEN